MIGAFWLPQTPGAVMAGTLVSDEHHIDLTVAPVYERQPVLGSGLFNVPDTRMIPAFHGFTERGLCTLCQVFEQGGPNHMHFELQQSIKSRAFRILTCVEGMHINGIDHKCLTSVKFSFAGLSEWFPSAFTEKWEADRIVVTIPNDPREIVDVSVCQTKVRITVRLVPEFTSGDRDLSRISRSVVSIGVQYPNPESLQVYRTVAGRLENLFSLLTGGSVALETLFLYRDDESGHMIAKRPGSRTHFDRLQCVICTPSELANAISIWLSLPSKFDSIQSLALEVLRKSKLFIETEFLALAQALEGFHRATTNMSATNKLTLRAIRRTIRASLDAQTIDFELKEKICNSMMHAGDPTLATRLAALCQSFSDATLANMGIVPDAFVSAVVVTRNFYTHAGSGERPNKKPVKGKEMFLLNQKMRSLLRGVMLLHLGLPESRIAEVLNRDATVWQ
jgi:ApeA N-terminal domain 1